MINKEIIQNNFSRQALFYNDYALVQKNAATKLCTLAEKILTGGNLENTLKLSNNSLKLENNSSSAISAKLINNSSSSSTILDLGSGTSFIAKSLINFDKNLKIFEVDIAENMLKSWSDRPSNVLPILADIENLPFEKTTSFDIIISSFALQWVNNFPQLLRQLYPLLKKNGTIIFCLPTEETFAEIKLANKESNCNFSIKNLPNANLIRAELLKIGLQEEYYNQEIIAQRCQSAVAFLKEIKKIGANYSEKFATKKNINKSNLQEFNDFFLQENNNVTHWHLAYFIFKK